MMFVNDLMVLTLTITHILIRGMVFVNVLMMIDHKS